MNLTKNFVSRHQSLHDSRQNRTANFATVNLLPGDNLGEIRSSIPARFWPPGLLLLGDNLGKIRGRIAPRFWPPGFFFSARILVIFAAGSWQDFGRRDFCFAARILARFAAGSRGDFGCREFRFPRSRRDPAKIPVHILQGKQGKQSTCIQQIVTLSKYGHDALDICHP